MTAENHRVRLFDRYIFVDWSAANRPTPKKPSKDAIWLADLSSDRSLAETHYHRTRDSLYGDLLGRLTGAIEAGLRVLVGFDFPYGYPSGFAESVSGSQSEPRWKGTWELLAEKITDTPANQNNRFEVASSINAAIRAQNAGPFWGCPANKVTEFLHSKSPGFAYPVKAQLELAGKRICETKLGGVQQVWKLYTIGCVGSQSLTGIPRVHALRQVDELKEFSAVWPFETGFTTDPSRPRGPYVLHAEIWPGVVSGRAKALLEKDPQLIKDQAQVRAMCEWARDLDAAGKLGPMFQPLGLDDDQIAKCVREEGWILGAQ